MVKKIINILLFLCLVALTPSALAQDFGTLRPDQMRAVRTIDRHTAARPEAEKLSTGLANLAANADDKTLLKELATRAGLVINGDAVVVTVLPEPGQITTAIDPVLLGQLGISVLAQAQHSLRLQVPIARLEQLARVSGVSEIREPIRPAPFAVTSEGLELMAANAWQNNGYQGAGVKIAIIDIGFENLSAAKTNGDIPTTFFSNDFTGAGLETGGRHGTAVAEAVYDLAPAAQYYYYKIDDVTDLQNAVSACKSNGVQIINHALGWFNVGGYYNGTGTVANIVTDALTAGITWVNSAGNLAESHYRALFSQGPDNYHNYGNGATLNPIGPDPEHFWYHAPGEVITIYLNWNNYPTTFNDYDLYLVYWNGFEWITAASSVRRQFGNIPPEESISYVNPYSNAMYGVIVSQYNTTMNANFTLFSLGRSLGYRTPASSLPEPATMTDVVTVGAIERNLYANGPQESFSSQGPTTDGRVKPDISAPDYCSTFSYGAWRGTSQSAAHVTGILAQIKSRFNAYTSSQLRNYLYNQCAVDLGPTGQDDIYGWGKVLMPTGLLTIMPESWNYQNVQVASYADKIFQLQNSGALPVQIQSLSLVGTQAQQFALQNPPATPFSLEPATSRNLTVRFQPSGQGQKEAELVLENNAGPTRKIPLSGLGNILLTHFTNTSAATGRSQPVFVTDAVIQGQRLENGDEIGIYDGTLLVGAGKVIGFPAADPIVVQLEYNAPNQQYLSGAKDGNPMLFRVWDRSLNREIAAEVAQIVVGSASFAEAALVSVKLKEKVNRPPVVDKAMADVILTEDAPIKTVANLDTVFRDPNAGEHLAYSARSGRPELALMLENQNLLKIIPAPDWYGTDWLWITATDPTGLSATDTVAITVRPVNDPPRVKNPLSDLVVNEDDPNRIAVALGTVFTDIDSPVLQFGANSDTTAVQVMIANSEAVLTLAQNWNGLARLRFSATDGEYFAYDSVRVTVNAVNDPPIVSRAISDLVLTQGQADTIVADLSRVFADIDLDSLSYSFVVDNPNIRITLLANHWIRIALQPTWHGTAVAIFSATDGEYFARDTVAITVNPIAFNPIPPVLRQPANDTELSGADFLAWSLPSEIQADQIKQFRIQLDDSSNGNNPEVDEYFNPANSVLIKIMLTSASDSGYALQLKHFMSYVALNDNIIYNWRIQIEYLEGYLSRWSAGEHFFYLNKANDAPGSVQSGFAPAHDAVIDSLNPMISWHPARDPDRSDTSETLTYALELARNKEFASAISAWQTPAGINYQQLDSLADGQRYFYRVQAIDDAGLRSDWSPIISFMIDSQPEPPRPFQLLQPGNGWIDTLTAEMLPVAVKFAWTNTSDPDLGDFITGYALALAEDQFSLANFTPADSANTRIRWLRTGTDTTITLMLPGSGFFWRVVAFDQSQRYRMAPEPSQPAWWFIIDPIQAVASGPDLPTEFELAQNYPNPFNPQTTITFALPKRAAVTISIIDLNGRTVAVLLNQPMPPGAHALVWPASQFPSGTYFIKMQAGDVIRVRKCVLLK